MVATLASILVDEFGSSVLEGKIAKQKAWAAVSRRAKMPDRLSFFDAVNSHWRAAFRRFLDSKATPVDMAFLRNIAFGTKQWSEKSYNYQDSREGVCPNCCLYCFINQIFVTYHRDQIRRVAADLELHGACIYSRPGHLLLSQKEGLRPAFKPDLKQLRKGWSTTRKPKLYMSPTSHDILPDNVDAAIEAYRKLLRAGNYLLVVSKPRVECIEKLIGELSDYRERMRFRFTITSANQRVLDVFEPFAPSFDERRKALRIAFDAGFQTSASLEPFLTDPVETIEQIRAFISHDMWIGSMNSFPSEVVLGQTFGHAITEEMARLKEHEYTSHNIERIVDRYKWDDTVQWKESIVNTFLDARRKGTLISASN